MAVARKNGVNKTTAVQHDENQHNTTSEVEAALCTLGVIPKVLLTFLTADSYSFHSPVLPSAVY